MGLPRQRLANSLASARSSTGGDRASYGSEAGCLWVSEQAPHGGRHEGEAHNRCGDEKRGKQPGASLASEACRYVRDDSGEVFKRCLTLTHHAERQYGCRGEPHAYEELSNSTPPGV